MSPRTNVGLSCCPSLTSNAKVLKYATSRSTPRHQRYLAEALEHYGSHKSPAFMAGKRCGLCGTWATAAVRESRDEMQPHRGAEG